MTLTREFAQNQRHEARTTPSPALCQRALMTTRHAPRCLPLHPDRVGVRHRRRARETSSRASRADITSSATSIATGNDVPHAKRHLCPSKHASRGSPHSRSNPTLAQAGNQAHRPHHAAAVGWSRGMRAALLSTACRGKTSSDVAKQRRSARQTPPTCRSASCPSSADGLHPAFH